MIHSLQSGLIQRVGSTTLRTETKQLTTGGSELAGDVMMHAAKDPDSPVAIPDIPTTEAPYDGFVCFGVFTIDDAQTGVAIP